MSSSDREPQASLIVGSELRELSRVSAWVQDWAQRQRLPARVAQHLDLCSTEVVTNIMTHGSGDAAAHASILLRLGWQGEDVALEVEDEGSPFDPLQAPEPTHGEQPPGCAHRRLGHPHRSPLLRRHALPPRRRPQSPDASFPADGAALTRPHTSHPAGAVPTAPLPQSITTRRHTMGTAAKPLPTIDTQSALAAQRGPGRQPNGQRPGRGLRGRQDARVAVRQPDAGLRQALLGARGPLRSKGCATWNRSRPAA